jgi:hypothetical protein
MAIAVTTACETPATTTQNDPSEELACAQRTIGGESGDRVKSLRITAARVPAADAATEMPGGETIVIGLPDRYRDERTSVLSVSSTTFMSIHVLDGMKAGWVDEMDGQPLSRTAATDVIERGRQEFARALVLWLLRDSPAFPVQWSVGDPPNTPAGRRTPNNRVSIRAAGPDGFNARLLVDALTCHPVAFEYERPATLSDRRAEQQSNVTVLSDTRLEHIDLIEYRSFSGVMFPTVLRRSIESRPVSEERVTDIKVNPALNTNEFQLPH